MPQVVPAIETFARIKVVGVGGAGGAAVDRMVDAGVHGVEFIAVNTDAQALHHSKAQTKVHIGKDTTKGLGSGADPLIGQHAAEESIEEITKALEGADMIFITIGAGGGTGSGAGPIVAQAASDLGVLVVGFATKPFAFEGDKRQRNAETAINNLRKSVDTLIVIPNDRLLQTIDRQTPLLEAFKVADDVLRQGVQGISDLITVHGLINLDFADVKTVMVNAGSALMGIGRASGENRAVQAAQQAIESPLLEVSIDGARGVLFNVIGGKDLSMHEINSAAELITSAADPEANIIFGATINPDLEDEVIITVVATGFDASYFSNRKETERKTKTPDSPRTAGSSLRDQDKDMSDLDMTLDENSDEEDEFNKDHPIANIWTLDEDHEEESNKDESDKSGSESEGKNDNESDDHSSGSNVIDEEEVEKPSFLRRLSKRHHKDEDDQN
ncbi:MAG TPA: cell division protein FtsZ [Candidatus Saccharimonadales bacterium]|nr:cell division protein FtsZ [Candidatus Saccharimonadales bacterium]